MEQATATFAYPEPRPDDVVPARCGQYGDTDKLRYLSCDRAKGHDGNHWDDTDERWWKNAPATEPTLTDVIADADRVVLS